MLGRREHGRNDDSDERSHDHWGRRLVRTTRALGLDLLPTPYGWVAPALGAQGADVSTVDGLAISTCFSSTPRRDRTTP